MSGARNLNLFDCEIHSGEIRADLCLHDALGVPPSPSTRGCNITAASCIQPTKNLNMKNYPSNEWMLGPTPEDFCKSAKPTVRTVVTTQSRAGRIPSSGAGGMRLRLYSHHDEHLFKYARYNQEELSLPRISELVF